jgi:radical SAM superfamily enzyme YgiQ (UPF0313 family)
MVERVLTCVVDEQPVTVRLRSQVINLLRGDERASVPSAERPGGSGAACPADSYSFDRQGRLIGAFVEGINYRRGLDNRVLQKWRGADGVRQRRWLPGEEADRFLMVSYGLAARVLDAVGKQATEPISELAVLRWDLATIRADAERFAEIYRPVSILPPDQYLALVLQASEGCSYNRCTFCDFYHDRRFRIKSPEQLLAHIEAVRAYFGAGLRLRKSLFLADANALVAPMGRLRGWLDVIERSFPGVGVYSFMDAFDVHRKTVAEWRELAERGLRRVYIGMESGDDGLLRFLRKPGSVADVLEAVETLKSAGLAASVIVMLGAGGDCFAAAHVVGTVEALNAMPLTAGDIIYFSPFVDHPGSEYGRLAQAAGIQALGEWQMAEQETAIRVGFRPRDPARAPQCARYDIREFVY